MLIIRDQRTALTALTTADDTVAAERGEVARSAEVARASAGAASVSEATTEGQQTETAGGDQPATAVASDARPTLTTDPKTGLRLAAVERGRIAMMGGITAVIWLVILILMVWH
jgi:Flp pilus assembly protein TadG